MIFCYSVNHHQAPLHIRETISLTTAQQQQWLSGLEGEAVILATCNRFELYINTKNHIQANNAWADLVAQSSADASISDYTVCYQEMEAAEHLFRVASGMESVVVGEPEILGQVTSAYEQALDADSTGATLSLLFRHAIHAAKEVRTHTDLGEGAVSFISVGIRYIEAMAGPIEKLDIMIIGAGDMGNSVMKTIGSRGATEAVVVSRTYETAELAATRWGLQAEPLEHIMDRLVGSDVVFCTSSAPHSIITQEIAQAAMAKRPNRPMYLIDLALPRDVEEGVDVLDDVHVFNLEDLERTVADSLEHRKEALPEAEALIAEELEKFRQDYRVRAIVPTIREMREQAEAIRKSEIERIMNRLPGHHDQYADLLDEFSQRIINKMLYHPTARLREKAADQEGELFESVLRDLFGLEVDE